MFCPQASWRLSDAQEPVWIMALLSTVQTENFTPWQKFALDSLDLGMAVGCQQDVEGAVNI